MKPFTQLEYDTYHANAHQIDFLKKQYDEFVFCDNGSNESDSDYNELAYLRAYCQTYLLVKAYMNAINV